ncbi:hypothetical protein ACIQ4I_05655 [Rummeliibacillus sp. NPDC094406]|uniref:hypothetical protein n=1 Tax=Rummeliibacillus sp. NPDC094406 TaxID=3364511 RepID=UPI0037F7E552
MQTSQMTQFASGNGIAIVKCPHPDCDHKGTFISRVHCRIHHQIERDEMFKKYGEPIKVKLNYALRRGS